MNPARQPFAIASALLLGVAGARAAGVAVLKDQEFHRDSSARAVVYSCIIDSRGPYLRLVSGRTNVEILRTQLAGRIEMPDSVPANLLEESDLAPLRGTLAEVRSFVARYPRSAPVLEQQTTALADYIRRFDAGEVRLEGEWISKQQLAAIRQTRHREDAAHQLAEVEKRVAEGSRRDQGLVLHDGRWMTPQDARQVPPDSPTELSDSIEPLWNGDLPSAKFAVQNLDQLAARQTGAPKVRTQRLQTAVRNLFLAESRLTQRILASAADTKEAAVHDQNAKKWLIPNAFGTVNEEASKDSREKAAHVRKRSADRLAACKRDLITQLREIDVVIADFQKLREQRVALILQAAARAVASRHFTEEELKPLPDDR